MGIKDTELDNSFGSQMSKKFYQINEVKKDRSIAQTARTHSGSHSLTWA